MRSSQTVMTCNLTVILFCIYECCPTDDTYEQDIGQSYLNSLFVCYSMDSRSLLFLFIICSFCKVLLYLLCFIAFCVIKSNFCPLPLNQGGGHLQGVSNTSKRGRRVSVTWGGHTPLPLLAAWLAAWLNPDWIGQWAVRRRHGFLSQQLFGGNCIQTLIKKTIRSQDEL